MGAGMKRVGDYMVPDAETLQLDALAQGGFQLDHLEAALAHVTDWRIAVDGGAHVGSWTRALAKRFDFVLAFEPAEDSFACLKANVGELVNVQLFQCALGAVPERMSLHDDEKYDGGNTGGRYLVPGNDILVEPLDDRHLDGLGFLKLDVEGYELKALHGARNTLARCKPVVLIEDKARFASRYGELPHAAASFLQSLGARELVRVGADRVFGWR